MRLLLVTHFYPAHGGGIEIVAAQLATRMATDGIEIVWCASNTDASPIFPGVRCDPMTAFNGLERLTGFPYPLWGPRSMMRLARHVRWADAVHVHDCIYASSLVAAWLARHQRKKLAVTQHIGSVPLTPPLGTILALANRIGARYVLGCANGVAFISPVVRRYFEAILGPSPRFHDVPNGVDGAVFFMDVDEPEERRAALGFDRVRPFMLFVGRFVPKKRLPLVRQMAALRPDWQWCIIGHGPEQPQTWGLRNVRVLAPMTQTELAAYYRAADLLVLPSHGEGFPLVVQEAMACGLPACISSEVAAGGAIPYDLWLELPEAQEKTAERAVAAIDTWLTATQARMAQRAACARHAATWRWDAAVRAHLRWFGEEVS